MSGQPELLRHIASALSQAGQHEKAGDLYERAHDLQQAMEAYRKGGAYRRAIELARTAYPTQVRREIRVASHCHVSYQVVGLEEEWGVYLCSKKQYETAIVHLIEAG